MSKVQMIWLQKVQLWTHRCALMFFDSKYNIDLHVISLPPIYKGEQQYMFKHKCLGEKKAAINKTKLNFKNSL